MFHFTSIDQDITRVRHEGPITVEDSCQFRAFLRNFRGRLLIDLLGTPPAEMQRELLRVRPMLPQTACVGADVARLVCDTLPGKDYYMYALEHFASDDAALAWLRGEEVEVAVNEQAFALA